MMIASAKADYNKGINYYNNRHEGSSGPIASSTNIEKAIEKFLVAIQNPNQEKDAAIYLLKSYYYYAEFAIESIEKKKQIFDKGKELGAIYIHKYPEIVEFRYWYLVNLGSWANVYGILAAAREGVADQMKIHSEKIIEINPKFKDGGGYFMLGATHYKSPYIPFLLSWPDNDEAIKYLQLSHDMGEATLNQKNYLAQAIYKDGQIEKAKMLLNEVINTSPNPDNLVEELDDIEEARQLLKNF
tara:strand:+ start:437 stop:1165 length:729 start_codon:yes stop_codon:yes gene_type:complete